MNRRVVLVGLLAVLAVGAGCTSLFGPGQPSREKLNENATYDWETDANVSITINRTDYANVYDVSNRSRLVGGSNDSQLWLSQRGSLGRKQPLHISALRYRFPNGTVVTADHDDVAVTVKRKRTVVSLPNGTGGKVAFTASRRGKRFATPVFLEGSYEIGLPPGTRVGIPLLSDVRPGGFERNVTDGRLWLHWDDVGSRGIRIRYYLQRDVLIFGTLVVIGIVAGTTGGVYYYRQIQQLKRRRETAVMEFDDEDDEEFRDP